MYFAFVFVLISWNNFLMMQRANFYISVLSLKWLRALFITVIILLMACSWVVLHCWGSSGTFLGLSLKLDFNKPVTRTTMGIISISSNSYFVCRSFFNCGYLGGGLYFCSIEFKIIKGRSLQ